MNGWVLSICATSLLTAIIGLIVPKGKVGGIIKCTFSLITVLVVIKPLINIKNTNFDFTFFNEKEIVLQDNFIDYSVNLRKTALENDLVNLLAKNGVKNSHIILDVDSEENNFVIKKAVVNLADAVINSDKVNINITEEITELISTYINVQKEMIFVYGCK